MAENDILTLEELAAEWGVKPRTMRDHIKSLRIPVLPGPGIRVYRPAYQLWCAENSAELAKHRSE